MGDAPFSVQKRDGRVVPFATERVEAGILRAMQAVGEEDPAFANEVAQVVELTLRERSTTAGAESEAPVATTRGVAEVQELVERALIGLGRDALARAYIIHGDRKARVREAVEVQRGDAAAPVRLRVREAGGQSGWSKGRIVAALMTEAELSREAAEEVAERVQRRVFSSGLRRVGTELLRALVDNELFELGLTRARRRQEAVGLPRHDLRRLMAGEPLRSWERPRLWRERPGEGEVAPGVGERVAGEVLRRYALQDVLGEAIAERHLQGELFVEDLEAPHQVLTLGVPSGLLASGAPGGTGAFDLLDELALVARCSSRGVVLEDPGAALFSLTRGAAGSLDAWLSAAGACARALRRQLDLASPGARYQALTGKLLDALERAPQGAFFPRLYLDGEELYELVRSGGERAAQVERLLGSGRVLSTWSSDEQGAVGPGLARAPRERGAVACSTAIAINLPRLARLAGPWREDLMLEGLQGLVHCALEAARSLLAFQEAHKDAPDALRTTGLRVRPAWALVPVGLREALRHLGEGEIDPSRGARILGFMDEAARRFSAESGLSAVLSSSFGERAAVRFAELDAPKDARGAGQGALFSDLAEDAPAPAYTTGFRLSPVAGLWDGEAEAQGLTTVAAGVLEPFARREPARESGQENGPTPWRRFWDGRVRGRAFGADYLFPAARRATGPPTSAPRPSEVARVASGEAFGEGPSPSSAPFEESRQKS